MARIKKIYESSPFSNDLRVGDDLIEINGTKIVDLLDYMFFSCDGGLTTVTVLRDGKRMSFSAEVEDPDLRLEFDDFLMDGKRSCKNKCVFCFIDQLPKGMRETLYYKDDDFRLSLLQGNYVTLTNLSDEDVQRIVRLRVSPLNISVHTTNPELRVKMMANPQAAKINDLLKRFAEADINMRCQIVLCPGLNDGEELTRSMEDLAALYPAVSSVSVVPVGLTKHREGLYPLTPFDAASAQKALDQILAFGDKCVSDFGTRLFYPADEFYVMSGTAFPGYDFYEDFEQLENGVGMVISFAQEFADALRTVRPNGKEYDCTLITGAASADLLKTCMEAMKKRFVNLNYRLYVIENEFFGKSVSVTGLITGSDILAQLKDKELGSYLLIPDVTLRDNAFLDDVTVRRVAKELNVSVKKVGCQAEELIRTVLKCEKK